MQRFSLCVLIALWCLLCVETAPRETAGNAPGLSVPRVSTPGGQAPAAFGDERLQTFQKSEFYRTIVDNNLFRPLGWRLPRRRFPYRLIGTMLPTDDHRPPRAIVQSTTGNTTAVVSPGDKLDAHTKVVSIEQKQVVLSTDGKQRTLHLPLRF